MRPVCTGAPVHYEQTVRARSTRPRAVAAAPAVYGYTGTLRANSQGTVGRALGGGGRSVAPSCVRPR